MYGVTKAQMQKIQKSKETEKTTTLFLSLKTQYKQNEITMKEKFKLNTEILMIASQDYQFWNDRKELITQFISDFNSQIKQIENQTELENEEKQKQIEQIQNQREELLIGELQITQKLLPHNSKAYVVWYHRKWTMNLLQNKNYKRERELCAQMLKFDSRNCLFFFSYLTFISVYFLHFNNR